jgi:hypothetical protein
MPFVRKHDIRLAFGPAFLLKVAPLMTAHRGQFPAK